MSAASKKKAATCSPRQQSHLRVRVSSHLQTLREGRPSVYDLTTDPPHIKALRRQIATLERQMRRYTQQRMAQRAREDAVIERAYRAASAAIHFKAPDVALAAVEAFEAQTLVSLLTAGRHR